MFIVFRTSPISKVAYCFLILGHSVECHSHKSFLHPVVHVLPFVQCRTLPYTCSCHTFLLYLNVYFSFWLVLKFIFIHGRLRQRCTLSQLQSAHCHLLQDYKHRVLDEPSDICTDCGASPQDVRHLFACTTHPTDLSPEDLWRNPVGSIRQRKSWLTWRWTWSWQTTRLCSEFPK